MGGASSGDPLNCIVGQAAKLGCHYPSEESWQKLTAIYLLIQNNTASVTAMSAEQKMMC